MTRAPSAVALMISLALCVAGAAVRPARAQEPRLVPQPELRADVIIAGRTAATTGAGVQVPLGTYVRLGLDASAGAAWQDGTMQLAGRADAIARFLLDPYRQVPVGLSLGGGLTLPVRQHAGRPTRPLLVGVIDLEGRRRGAWTPAVQLGLGGGVRLGLALRHSARLTR